MPGSKPENTTCLIATVKNEGPWLLEWIAHNRAIGFDSIVVASNDCEDGTDLMLDRLQALGHLRHIRNTPPWPNGIQIDAYEKARRYPEAANARWLMALDADEFLNIHIGQGLVTDLIDTHTPETQAIIVNWRVFGDSDRAAWSDVPVCEAFTMAASERSFRAQVKTLFRDHQDYTVITPHGPWRYPAKGHFKPVKARTAAGASVRPDIFQRETEVHRVHPDKVSWSAAQVNHYIVKTRDVFDLKKTRGRPIDPHKARHTAEFFEHMNCNHEEDLSIQRTAEARTGVFARLLEDAQLAELHALACENLQKRLSDAKT